MAPMASSPTPSAPSSGLGSPTSVELNELEAAVGCRSFDSKTRPSCPHVRASNFSRVGEQTSVGPHIPSSLSDGVLLPPPCCKMPTGSQLLHEEGQVKGEGKGPSVLCLHFGPSKSLPDPSFAQSAGLFVVSFVSIISLGVFISLSPPLLCPHLALQHQSPPHLPHRLAHQPPTLLIPRLNPQHHQWRHRQLRLHFHPVVPAPQQLSAEQVLTLLQNPWLSSLVANQLAVHAPSGLLPALLLAALLPALAKAQVHGLPPSCSKCCSAHHVDSVTFDASHINISITVLIVICNLSLLGPSSGQFTASSRE
ncbi:hypothetical protein EV702DRAFT_1043666 [Suillus placidus]|uniref:Uncharacterized protein n=1 Tax=Suillus placidus TaxID=48579 RepID=A0A9P7A101_9AGAM|nr:hypothetical protein EV702DRAFT_1043666 [Suillus placidus]